MKNDGGTALPGPKCHYDHEGLPVYLGLSLRDYFAAKVLNGLISHGQFNEKRIDKEVCSDCYKVADAMLAAREEK